MDVQRFRLCFCFWRRYKLRAAAAPEEIKELFKKYSENGAMSVDHLHRFLVEIQGEVDATKERGEEIFHQLRHLNLFQRKELRMESFFRYLLSDYNQALPWPSKVSRMGRAHFLFRKTSVVDIKFVTESNMSKIHQEMNAPLAHYFIYTGHNSYLTGNQLSSDSSVEPIIKALKKGVRVIELDLWPNPTRDDVMVHHGRTLTTPIKLIKCLKAIKDYAFHASEYPVIITFEDHLTPDLQAKVAKMVTKTFGRALFSPESDFEEFSSPESLKRRILISTKPPENEAGKPQQEVMKSAADEEAASENNYLPIEKETDAQPKKGTDNCGDHEDEDGSEEALGYRQLIAIHAVKLKAASLVDWLSGSNGKVRRLSMSEEELERATKEKGRHLVRFTQRNLLRVYPKATRFLSSNYDPLAGWAHGAQMVAFNMQGYGKNLWIMQGMFRANGGCGYVKKPNCLLSPRGSLPVGKTLKVKVYMGEGWHLDFRHTHFDTCSPPDFYVKIGIAGVPGDETKSFKTTTDNNQWIPIWNEEFEFTLRVPELAFLRLKVKDEDTSGSDFAGQTCLPVSELRTGIRSVPLYNRKGRQYKSVKLLVGIELLEI